MMRKPETRDEIFDRLLEEWGHYEVALLQASVEIEQLQKEIYDIHDEQEQNGMDRDLVE